MRRSAAATGSAAFFALAPSTVAGLIPWLLTRWAVDQQYWWPVRLLGAALITTGGLVLVQAFVRFVLEGRGTPAPVAPPERLVIGGLYRYVRNPMYLAVLAAIAGQALVLGQPVLWLYGALVGAAVVSFVKLYEEPTLAARHGTQYDNYRREVRGWWPRLSPRRKGS
jgi:protein-S-isoprenylcysteine O-methyltransferase Ste14